MKAILSEKRSDVSITASLAEMVENPYIIFEQYIGMDSDDTIPFYKIDNGMIASPEYGIADIFDAGATERLRAFCVDELNRIAAHSFGKAETILKSINHRLDRMPDWKRYTYKLKNFKIDRDILDKALEIKEDDDKTLYLYLKWVYEDERQIENVFTMLAERPDISLKMAITKEKFKKKLRNPESRLNETASEQYEAILDKQADICMQIFSKPICVLAGAAGTGKTTVIKAIVENIERVHGQAAGFLLMAPTGKAAERIKTQTEKNSMTIHSYLAGNGWLNRNFTLKRVGGSKGQDVNTIIIDECSMIDLNLFAALVRSINWNSVQRLILVGDPNQLPPIGRGKVFSDTIAFIEYRDSLSDQNQDKGKYSLILANPPFKGSLDAESVSGDLLKVCKTKKTELLFLALFVRMLKVGGRCACIVPDGVLFGSSKAHKDIRKEIVENQRLEAVISMPSGVFKPYAGVSTAILIFTKTEHGGTDNVWFYDMTADGFSLDDKRSPIAENDIPDIIERFKNLDKEIDRKRTDKSFMVPKQDIVENGYDLSINKYKEIEYVPVEYPSTIEIMTNIREIEMEIGKEMEELEKLLDL